MNTDIALYPKVSVIVPVYNVEHYIQRCIDSLKAQTLQELEFIFVNDCSTDDSMAVIEVWAAEDSRVRILQNETNSGPGYSRNCGIDIARGMYLGFVDPDDYISPVFFELLYTKATEDGLHDIAKGNQIAYEYTSGEAYESRINAGIVSRNRRNAPLWMHFKNEHFTAIYRHSLFENPLVRFGSSRAAEDTTFLLRVCSTTEDIVLESRAEYYYIKRPNSINEAMKPARLSYLFDGLEEKLDILLRQKEKEYVKEYLDKYLNWCNYVLFNTLKGIPSDQIDTFALKDRLSITLSRCPQYEWLAYTHPELFVFANYGVVLPSDDEDVTEKKAAWSAFLSKHAKDARSFSIAYANLACRELKQASLSDRYNIWQRPYRYGFPIGSKIHMAMLRQWLARVF